MKIKMLVDDIAEGIGLLEELLGLELWEVGVSNEGVGGEGAEHFVDSHRDNF